MKKYSVKKHGLVLTGRDYGIEVMKEIRSILVDKMALDFSDVSSLGSSFGDEVVTPIAKHNGGIIEIYNATSAVKAALKDVEEDGEIKIIFKDGATT